LRQDPNVIMVGEIRDTETAELAINAALTGHWCFRLCTQMMHRAYLQECWIWEVEPFLLVSSLNCVVGQRVLRRICQKCGQEIEIPADTEAEMRTTLGPIYDVVADKWKKENKQMKMMKPVGCEECNNTGYLGRVAIYEVMPITEKIAN
jgi:type IV pilus assembly protein PilB